MAEYFIRRNGKVHGPFSSSQIQSGVKSKKLSGDDSVSRTENGPWTPLSNYFNKKSAATPPKENTVVQPSVAPSPVATPPPEPPSEPPVVVHREPVMADESVPHSTSSDEAASLYFVRKMGAAGAMGALTKVKVFVDGEMKAKLALTQSVDVAVPAGSHDIEVKGGGAFRGAKTTVSVEPGGALCFVVKYSAMGGLKLVPTDPPPDGSANAATASVDGESLSVNDVANIVDGVNTVLGFFDDDE